MLRLTLTTFNAERAETAEPIPSASAAVSALIVVSVATCFREFRVNSLA